LAGYQSICRSAFQLAFNLPWLIDTSGMSVQEKAIDLAQPPIRRNDKEIYFARLLLFLFPLDFNINVKV
jgi:hypothetical protein